MTASVVRVAARIPFYNFRARYARDGDLVRRLVAESTVSEKPILGARVAELEGRICDYLGARHAVGLASGTGALLVALRALGIGPGDEVVVPAFTFHSPASSVLHLGGRVRFVDVRLDTCTIDPAGVPAALTGRTRVVLPVHIFSVLADVEQVRRAAPECTVLEDAAVAFGMRLGGTAAGLLGDLGVFSFHPAKLLGGIGDAGMVVTNDEELARRVRMLRNHGQDGVNRFLHHVVGFNCRMDDVVAAYLSHRLQGYEAGVERRAAIAAAYDERLRGLAPALVTPPEVEYRRAFYTYVVQAEERDALREHLARRGIETRLYYPLPLHLQPAFAGLGYGRGDFPNAELLSRRTLALPLYPELPDEHVEAVAGAVLEFHAG